MVLTELTRVEIGLFTLKLSDLNEFASSSMSSKRSSKKEACFQKTSRVELFSHFIQEKHPISSPMNAFHIHNPSPLDTNLDYRINEVTFFFSKKLTPEGFLSPSCVHCTSEHFAKKYFSNRPGDVRFSHAFFAKTKLSF